MYFGAGRKQQAEEQAIEPAGSNERKRASAGKIHREQKKSTPQHRRVGDGGGVGVEGGRGGGSAVGVASPKSTGRQQHREENTLGGGKGTRGGKGTAGEGHQGGK
eukprot:55219-Heterocapsa_arctica.AAC.1